MRAAVATALLAPLVHAAPAVQNMNGGGEYLFQNPNTAPTAGKFETQYGKRWSEEFFDVYAGPISTRYGEVFWQGLPAVPLPADIVSRFDGKAIAITGYEVDQVMVDNATKDSSTTSGFKEQSVPIYWAYNHHYVSWLKGKHATMVDLDGSDHTVVGHPLLMNAFAIDDPIPSSDIPTSQFFSEGNGGEMRKSYHGYPKGFAQLIDSPTEFVMTPMQVNRWKVGLISGLISGMTPCMVLSLTAVLSTADRHVEPQHVLRRPLQARAGEQALGRSADRTGRHLLGAPGVPVHRSRHQDD